MADLVVQQEQQYEGSTPVHLDITAIKEQMRTNLNVFASIIMPDDFDKPFSDAHQVMWQMLIESVTKVRRHDMDAILDKFALGLPRGHAKTTMLKLLVVYVILFTKRRFILVVCSVFGKAASFIGDVTLLLDSPNLIELFGRWDSDVDKDNDKIRKFTFCGRRIILKPSGHGGSVRGISEDLQRPDLIICDDIQEKEDAENPEQAEKLLNWFLATLLKARNLQVATICYLGNMYKDLEIGRQGSGIYCCLLRNLQLNPEWTSMIVGAILADGSALWEAVVTKKSLLSDLNQDRAMGKEDVFFAESQNDPRVRMSAFYNPSKVPPLPYNQYDTVIGKFLVIDPSLGSKKSDSQIVGLFHVYDEKGPVCVTMKEFQVSAPQLVESVLMWAVEDGIPLVCAESVAYQGTLLQWFVHYCELLSIEQINFMPVHPRGLSKVSRILAYLKSLMEGRSMADVVPLAMINNQASFYKPLAQKNADDVLDVGAYGEQAFLDYSELWLLPLDASYSVIQGEDKSNHPALLSNVRLPQS